MRLRSEEDIYRWPSVNCPHLRRHRKRSELDLK